MRTAFLIKAGLDKEAFIGTGTVAAVVVDIARLLVYGVSFYTAQFRQLDSNIGRLVVVAILAAFLGSFLGARLVKKVTLRTIQLIVGAMLVIVGLGMVSGQI